MNAFVSFSNVASLLRAIEVEASDKSHARGSNRFCGRFILVSTTEQWNELVRRLKEMLHPQEIRLSKFVNGESMPSLTAWQQELLSETVLLLPLMEALRFRSPINIATALTTVATYIGGTAKPNPHRLYAPLLCSQKTFERHLQGCDRFRQGLLPPIWSLPHEGPIPSVVLAPQFPSDIQNVTEGIASYLALWENATAPSSLCPVKTSLASWIGVAGDEIATICSTARATVQRFIPLIDLPEDVPEVFWNGLIDYGQSTDTNVNDIANRLLNCVHFQPERVVVSLLDIESESKESALLWAALKCWSKHAGGYLATVCQKSTSSDQLTSCIYSTILDGEWGEEDRASRRDILRKLVDIRPSDYFIDLIRSLPARNRLELLTDASLEEKKLIVEAVGELLAQGHSLSTLRLWLQDIFPLLCAYLRPFEGDADLQDYFQRFVEARLRNEATLELKAQQQKISSHRQDLPHIISHRSHVLADIDAPVRWLDGLGLEWQGVLLFAAHIEGVGCEIKPARASLPTNTASNKEWSSTDEKSEVLDKLGHAGDYVFPASFLMQLQAVYDFVRDMAAKLRRRFFGQNIRQLVLTGDHGLTPVVFHKEIVPVPLGFEYVNGRSLRRISLEAAFPQDVSVEGDYCYIQGAGRFASGQTKGTIHGGATLEELIVPVVTLKLDREEILTQPVKLQRTPMELTLSPLGKVTLEITLSRPARDVLLEQGIHFLTPIETRDELVVFELHSQHAGRVSFSIYAEQRRIGAFSVQLHGGLDMNDMGI
jgi:hypothetical protein